MYTGKIIHSSLTTTEITIHCPDNAPIPFIKTGKEGCGLDLSSVDLIITPKGILTLRSFILREQMDSNSAKGFANSAKEMMALFGSEQKIKDYLILIRQQAGFNLLLTPRYITMCTDFVSTAITCGWGAFSKGLYRIHLKNKEVKTYVKAIGENTLNSNDIFSIYRSKTGVLWVGTTYGLLTYNRQTDDFTRISELNGIFVYDIQEDYSEIFGLQPMQMVFIT